VVVRHFVTYVLYHNVSDVPDVSQELVGQRDAEDHRPNVISLKILIVFIIQEKETLSPSSSLMVLLPIQDKGDGFSHCPEEVRHIEGMLFRNPDASSHMIPIRESQHMVYKTIQRLRHLFQG